MNQLPDLSTLSHADKDELIHALWNIVQTQAAQITKLEARVKELEDKLSKNSSNSSQPPSSDGFNKPAPKSRRDKSKKKKVGGQPGHKGKTLRQSATPDIIEHHDPDSCWHCCSSLSTAERLSHESRQVFDLPPMELAVTEHRAYNKRCLCCKVVTKGCFPQHIKQPAQYGDSFKSLLVYLQQYQLLPFERIREFVSDVFNQPVSVATIKSAREHIAANLIPAENHIKEQLIQSQVLHADETGLRVNKDNYWLHTICTDNLTLYAAHKKRGKVAMNDIDILPKFDGTLVHDHFKSYFNYGASHGLCNAHHLRELTFIQERYEHTWAKKMERLLINIKKAVESHYQTHGTALPEKKIKRYQNTYMNLICRAREECPKNMGEDTKKRGRIKQTKARCLLERLRIFNRSVLAFMYDPTVPFDNNQAERDLRMMKVQQKISGCFRTTEGLNNFCRIRGYISTAKKQGQSVLDSLLKAFQNQPVMFNA